MIKAEINLFKSPLVFNYISYIRFVYSTNHKLSIFRIVTADMAVRDKNRRRVNGNFRVQLDWPAAKC